MLRQLSLLVGAFCAAVSLFAQSNDYTIYGSFSEARGGNGAVYALNPDGTAFQTIKEFPNNPNGQTPMGSLVRTSDGYLYGICQAGGDGSGTIIEFKDDGTGFKVVHKFTDAAKYPLGGLATGADNYLYGMSSPINSNSSGSIYRIHRDGTGFSIIHDFSGTGLGEEGMITVDTDGTIYGVTTNPFTRHVLFKMNPDGTAFTILHEFDDVTSIQAPNAHILLASNGYMYGITSYNGINEKGTVYRIKKDGTSFAKIFDFPSTLDQSPGGNLVEVGGKLYGSASLQYTCMYTLNLDGSGFNVFASSPQIGYDAGATSVTSDGKLIVVSRGGGANMQGAVTRMDTDGNNATVLDNFEFQDLYLSAATVLSNGDVMGTRSYGYESMNGCIYRLPANGTMSILQEFSQPEGAQPMGNLQLDDNGVIYGITQRGGSYGAGVVYSMKKDGTDYQVLHDIDRQLFSNAVFADLSGPILASDGFLYATTPLHPTSLGTIYKIGTDGQHFEELYAFGGLAGELPTGTLLEASDGMLYGMTAAGGTLGTGVIYKINKDGSGFQKIHDFEGAQVEGGSLAEGTDGYLFGMMRYGGAHNRGSLFKIKMDGTGHEKITDFGPGIGGALNGGSLINHPDGRLYGMTGQYGTDSGVIFSIASDGTDFKTFYNLAPSSPINSLVLSGDGYFYGHTVYSGDFFSVEGDGSPSRFLPLMAGTPSPRISLQPAFLLAEKADQNITFTMAEGATVLDVPITLSAVSNLGLTVTFESDNDEVATISGNTLTIKGGGVVHVTAKQPGDIFTKGAAVTHTLIVTKVPQTITFVLETPVTYEVAPIELSASSSSELPVSYSSSNENVATVNGSTVTIVGAGTTTLTALQAGSEIYAEAESVAHLLTVEKADQIITFEDIPAKTIGSPAFTLNASASSQLALTYSTTSDKVTLQGPSVTVVKAGKLTIKAEQAGNNNYNSAEAVEKSFCINPLVPTITLTPTIGGAVLTSSSDAGNQWYRNGTAVEGATEKELSLGEPGVYTVVATTDDCSSGHSETIDLIATGLESGSFEDVLVFDNPVSHVLKVIVSTGQEEELTMEITDGLGRRMEFRTGKSNREETFNVAHFTNGIYYLRASGTTFRAVKRVYKQ